MPVKERAVLLLIRPRAMMLALIFDVNGHVGDARLADRKCAVAVLPGELAQIGERVVDPGGRSAFDELRGFRRRERRRRTEEHVNMVIDAAGFEGLHLVLAGDSSQVFPNPLFDLPPDPRLAIFGAENEMVMQGGVRVGHSTPGGGRGNRRYATGRMRHDITVPGLERPGYRQCAATRR